MKKIVIFLLLILPLLSWSEEIKLSCNMKRTVLNSHLADQNSNETIIVEIIDLGKYKSIVPNSDQYAAVGSFKMEGVTNISDNSDKNKWDITRTYTSSKSSGTSITTIRIDRNTGNIYYISNFAAKIENNSVVIQTTATGDCEKINVMKKKF
jgi:hypothetical protein